MKLSLMIEGVHFIREVYDRRQQIYNLTRRDFTDRYSGSFLGLIWAFIEPLAMMSIMWAVFSLGFRTRAVGDGIPFVAYLFVGQSAFNFFQDAIGASSNVIRAYSFLVKKVKFKIAILPIVKINTALVIHLIILLIVVPIIWISGITPSFYWLQVFYYIFALFFLILGISWFLAAIGVFIRDISNFVQIILNICFWLTPIFWNIEMVPEKYRIFLFLNPLYYIIQGYRDSFLYHIPFWNHPIHSLYFWSVASLALLLGILVFKKLRPHFADVL